MPRPLLAPVIMTTEPSEVYKTKVTFDRFESFRAKRRGHGEYWKNLRSKINLILINYLIKTT